MPDAPLDRFVIALIQRHARAAEKFLNNKSFPQRVA